MVEITRNWVIFKHCDNSFAALQQKKELCAQCAAVALLIVFADEVTGLKGLQFCYINKFDSSLLLLAIICNFCCCFFSNPLFTLKPFL